MICRFLKSLAWVLFFVSGLTACAQVDTPEPSTQTTTAGHVASKRATLSSASTEVRLFGHAAASARGASTATNNSSNNVSSNGDLWDHLRSNFQLPAAANNPEVQSQIRWYVHHQDYLNRVITRAAPYMYFILEQTQQRNLPAELVLLPIMESAYNPFANSNRGAVGLWQLIHSTAYGFGVKQDWWYDGRRDIYASTNAALDYLTYLQSYFGGDWMLAIAAYDAGEGTLQVAVRKNARQGKNEDFWSLQLPAETRSYVPRLLALAAIINNPGRYSISLPTIDDHPYLQQVDLGAPINLAQAAKLAGMSLGAIKQLNPGYSHVMTGPNGPYRLLLPIDRITSFKENLAANPSLSQKTWEQYKVKKGESLAILANRCNTTVEELAEANELKSHKAPVGKTIMLPMGGSGAALVNQLVTLPNTPTTSPLTKPTGKPDYNAGAQLAALDNTGVVSPNNSAAPMPATTDTASAISTDDSDNDTTSAAPTSKKIVHTVKHGETLMTIARQYRVKVADIQRWNKSVNKSLKPGAKIVVYTKASSQTGTSSKSGKKIAAKKGKAGVKNTKKPKQHVVQSGDTLSGIAKHHGVKTADLKKLNPHTTKGHIKPGQKLVVKN